MQAEKRKVINFIKNFAEQRIEKEADKVQVSYDKKDIIVTDVFINELYNALSSGFGVDDNTIFDAITTKRIKPEYDNIIFYLNVRFVGMLDDDKNFNLSVLSESFRNSYNIVVSALVSMLVTLINDSDDINLINKLFA